MPPLTVLQIIPRLESGGAERTTVEIAAALVSEGMRALVATSGGRLVREIEAAGGEVFLTPVDRKDPVSLVTNAKRLAALIGEEGVDLADVRSRAPAWSALWAARRARIPLVTTYHGAYRSSGPLKTLYNSSMARGDIVIANSRYTADAIRAQHKVDPTRLLVIPRGADLAYFSPSAVSPEKMHRLASRWGLDDGSSDRPFLTLLPARLTAWKGHATAIAALSQLVRENRVGRASGLGRDLKLVFVGDNERADVAERLKRACETGGVGSMISFAGHCADMREAYALADAVLCPSTEPEAFGRVAVEAAAMEKIAIGADHGGQRETIIDGVTGFLTSPGDSQALAAAIEKVARLSVEERDAFGRRAGARARSLYSTSAMCAATIEAYRRLAPGRA